MKAKELKGLEAEELQRELQRLRQQIFELRFKWQNEENADTSQRLKAKRDIARILTILRERELAGSKHKQ